MEGILDGIKNIVFDMGGVLIDLDRQACVDAFARIGFTEADKMLSNYHQQGIFGNLERGTVSPDELYEYIRSAVGRPVTGMQIDAALMKFLTGLDPAKLDLLVRLRTEYRVFMLSNTNPIMMEYIPGLYFAQRGLAMSDYFDALFLSYQMHMLKPEPGIYLKMLADGRMLPGETLFLDDGEANVEAARGVGIRSLPVTPGEDLALLLGLK